MYEGRAGAPKCVARTAAPQKMSVKPSANGKAASPLKPAKIIRAPNRRRPTQIARPRQPIRLFVGSGMSRIARDDVQV